MEKVCVHCGTDKDLRPYGPGGSWTCFPCMNASPELTAIAEKIYEDAICAAYEASRTGVVIIGEETGPRPEEMGDLQ